MVARGDKHRAAGLPQGPDQGLSGLGIELAAVEQVAGEQHQVGSAAPGQLGQAGEQLPLLPPAPGGLLGVQRGEGRIQMEVCRV